MSRDIPDPSTLADRAIARAQRLEVVERAAEKAAAEWADECRRLAQERDEARARGMCDACAGTGKPISGLSCMCGGTGAAADAVCHLRDELFRAKREAATARDERDAARLALATLLDALGSSRDDVRIKAVAEAMETRRGWGL